jgi:5'-phosphate synthase pdxT subunit
VGAKIGVLALQGDVSEHIEAFRNAITASGSSKDLEIVTIRKKQDLDAIDALALPGGESTTISRLIDRKDLHQALVEFEGGIFATCAGMVVMAREVDDPGVHSLGLLDISVRRNAFGRQRESFEADLKISGFDRPFRAVFIRAPVADHTGAGVRVLCSMKEGVVALEQGRHLALSFHPELVNDPRLHILFLTSCGLI